MEFGNKNARRISYAASIGKEEITKNEDLVFKRYLDNLDFISVREESAKNILDNLTSKEIETVLDPTLLLDREDYDKLKIDPGYNEEYIYVHNVHLKKEDDRLINIANAMSHRLHLPIVSNFTRNKFARTLKSFKADSPEKIVGVISNAKYVITNSFHTTVFSIIYNKEFITVPHFKFSTRMQYLLNSLGLSNRLCDSIEELTEQRLQKINYEKVYEKILENRKQSVDFLNKALYGTVENKKLTFLETENKFTCYGCEACKFICPQNAIKMVEDEEGFSYPVINEELCNQCGNCKEVCIYKKENLQVNEKDYPKVFASYNKDIDVRKQSTSGGIFTPLYNYIISEGGAVIGVKYDKNMVPIYDIAYTAKDCEAFRGSKYVEAEKNDILIRTKIELDKNIPVLFSGTPCQIAALKSFLNKQYYNLFCIEIICHGTPSLKIFKDYVAYLENDMNSKMTNLKFRDKQIGWHKAYMQIEFKNGNIINEEAKVNNYNRAFLNDFIQRPSCYNCEFTRKGGVADITIGDFWGIENTYKEMDDNLGISIIKINTPVGNKLFNQIKSNLELKESTYDIAFEKNHIAPIELKEKRCAFFEEYESSEVNNILLKYNQFKKNKQ